MKWDIIQPNSINTKLEDKYKCKIFLAGPTQGNKTWRNKVIEDIKAQTENIDDNGIIISPQWGDAIADPEHFKSQKFNEEAQVKFETRHLLDSDIIIFGLFTPDAAGREKAWTDTRDYAQTTRFELGRYTSTTVGKSNNSVIIYGEEGFKGLSYIKLMTPKNNKNRIFTKDYTVFLDSVTNRIKDYTNEIYRR